MTSLRASNNRRKSLETNIHRLYRSKTDTYNSESFFLQSEKYVQFFPRFLRVRYNCDRFLHSWISSLKKLRRNGNSRGLKRIIHLAEFLSSAYARNCSAHLSRTCTLARVYFSTKRVHRVHIVRTYVGIRACVRAWLRLCARSGFTQRGNRCPFAH